jgi:hypothetical protein
MEGLDYDNPVGLLRGVSSKVMKPGWRLRRITGIEVEWERGNAQRCRDQVRKLVGVMQVGGVGNHGDGEKAEFSEAGGRVVGREGENEGAPDGEILPRVWLRPWGK